MGRNSTKSANRPVATANSAAINIPMMSVINSQADKDQYLRTQNNPNWDEINKTDKESTRILKSFIKQYGYPSANKYGVEFSRKSWLLVQHSPDLKFMKTYLQLMKKENEQPLNEEYAFLTDRIRMRLGKKQIYGTQVTSTNNSPYTSYPIINPKEVNKRREKIGLEPIEQYMQRFN